jgi:hypothetical protein
MSHGIKVVELAAPKTTIVGSSGTVAFVALTKPGGFRLMAALKSLLVGAHVTGAPALSRVPTQHSG